MIMAIPGFKLAMMAAAAVGIGAAVVTHWDDIRFIMANFEECKEEAQRVFKRMQARKAVASEYSRRSETPEPDIFYSNDYEDVYDSDATTRMVLRHRRETVDQSQSQSQDSGRSRSSSTSSSVSSTMYEVKGSQLSMPSNHNIADGILEVSDGEISTDPMSDFSIISSDGEWSDGGAWDPEN